MRNSEREPTPDRVVEPPSLDEIFELLANQQRRYVLYHLREVTGGVTTMEELAENVVALQDQSGPPDGPRGPVLTSLRHVHLPKLQDAGVLEYDPRSEAIRYWGQPSLDEWLEHAMHKEL